MKRVIRESTVDTYFIGNSKLNEDQDTENDKNFDKTVEELISEKNIYKTYIKFNMMGSRATTEIPQELRETVINIMLKQKKELPTSDPTPLELLIDTCSLKEKTIFSGRSGATIEQISERYLMIERSKITTTEGITELLELNNNIIKQYFIKKNKNQFLTNLELKISKNLEKIGHSVPKIKKISDTELKINKIDGLNFFEELFYDNNTPEKIIKDLKDKYGLSTMMNAAIPVILNDNDKDKIYSEKMNELLKQTSNKKYVQENPELSKIVLKAMNFENKSVSPLTRKKTILPPEFYIYLNNIETMIKPFRKDFEKWSLDSYGANFIGDYRIDMNSVNYGIMDDSFLLDTPYRFNNLDWTNLSAEDTKKIEKIEKAKQDIFIETNSNPRYTSNYSDKHLNPVWVTGSKIAFNVGRIYRNLQQAFHTIEDIKTKYFDEEMEIRGVPSEVLEDKKKGLEEFIRLNIQSPNPMDMTAEEKEKVRDYMQTNIATLKPKVEITNTGARIMQHVQELHAHCHFANSALNQTIEEVNELNAHIQLPDSYRQGTNQLKEYKCIFTDTIDELKKYIANFIKETIPQEQLNKYSTHFESLKSNYTFMSSVAKKDPTIKKY